MNVWRGMGTKPIVREPLALLDASSVSDHDVFTYEMVTRPAAQSAVLAELSEHQRWWYYPQMERDEALVFFGGPTFERQPNGARFVFHSAIEPRDARLPADVGGAGAWGARGRSTELTQSSARVEWQR